MKDNITYAEIRPNFMTSNQLWTDDGTKLIDNKGIMELIISEVNSFQADMKAQGRFFGGLKVIYCTPRSFPPEKIEAALTECLEFKKVWPEWIAGKKTQGHAVHCVNPECSLCNRFRSCRRRGQGTAHQGLYPRAPQVPGELRDC